MPTRRLGQARLPVLTITTLGLSVAFTATRLFGDGPLDALRRDPTALGHGQVWRLVSPVLVQSDPALAGVALVFVACAMIGAFAERILSPGRWLTLYFCGALTGHAVGEAFQPLQGGTSVAFVGILGGLAAYALAGRDPRLARFRVQAAVGIPLAILDTALGDIHGVPYLAGMAVGAVWILRDEGHRVGSKLSIRA
jgi:membrane associated rhomboid family serine protease